MQKGVLDESVSIVERAVDRLTCELSSLFSVGRDLPADERLARADLMTAISNSILSSLEDKLATLREVVEKAEEKKEIFFRAWEAKRPLVSPRAVRR